MWDVEVEYIEKLVEKEMKLVVKWEVVELVRPFQN